MVSPPTPQHFSLESEPERTIRIEGAVLRKHLGPPLHVHKSLEDGIESDIDEFRIRISARVGKASDFVPLTTNIHLCGP